MIQADHWRIFIANCLRCRRVEQYAATLSDLTPHRLTLVRPVRLFRRCYFLP